MLFKAIKPHLTTKDLSPLQESVWKKVCEKAQVTPSSLTPLEAFQIGKLTQKVIDFNEEYEGFNKNAETEFLRETQEKIKISLHHFTKNLTRKQP